MTRGFRTVLGCALAAVAVGAGCSSSSQQPPNEACPAIEQVAPQLVYPSQNAAGVPTAAGYIVVNAPVAGADVTLVPYPIGATLNLGPLVANPSPIPMPTSTAATNGELFGVLHPALASQTTYSVNYVSTTNGRCSTVPGSSGSFTTQ
jgi:hypothetical protein